MKRWLWSFLMRLARRLTPKPDISAENRALKTLVKDLAEESDGRRQREQQLEALAELAEARMMAGSGPWKASRAVLEETDQLIKAGMERYLSPEPVGLRETAITQNGLGADLSLMLENLEWRREINLSWLEFSRWGIQQVILISRLYYLKNPIIRRLIDIASVYVFARGVEVSTDNEAANDVLKDFFERNKSVVGQIALVDLEKRKYYDGNLFFVFFVDATDKGLVNIRTIDATEIQEITTDPDDVDTPQLYKRVWGKKTFSTKSGAFTVETMTAWYPALNYKPTQKPKTINGDPVNWNTPIYHRKDGAIAKWLFGCPKIYPALDWAKASREFLQSCATVKRALAQISMKLTTKGGQQALAGAKQALGTTVGPVAPAWDTNPPTTTGGIFASGPGTQLEAFNTKNGGGDPEEVRRYLLMCCMVVGVPETFLADVSTGNLATATTLDRPTELVFMERQEAWREDLVTIANFVLSVNKGAASGKLSEAKIGRIIECERKRLTNGRLVYEARTPTAGEIRVKATFPAIREGDTTQLVAAWVDAATLGNKGGQVVGIDEKTAVLGLMEILGVENPQEIADEMYPEGEYELDRTVVPLADPIGRADPSPGGEPQAPGGVDPPPLTKKVATAERLLKAVQRIQERRARHPTAR